MRRPAWRRLSLVVLACTLPALTALAAATYSGPEDQAAVREAREAVKRLGPGRGGVALEEHSLPYTGRSVEVVGLEASVSGTTSAVEQALKDLGAKKTEIGIQISLSGDVLFDFDSWQIRKEAEDTLRQIADAVRKLGKRRMIIEGHTDSKGSEAYNLKLSQRRAEAVKTWFLHHGRLKGVVIQTIGYGETRPVAPNTHPDGSDNPQGRAKNRRVEIRLPD